MNSDIIRIDLHEDEIRYIIHKVISKLNISKIDNLRDRYQTTQFDSLLRGHLGEYAIVKWMLMNDITFTDINYQKDGEVIDIDLYYKNINIEVKTSMVPDADESVQKSVHIRDIKLIRRGNSSIEEIRGDVHLQIMFDIKRQEHDEWLLSRNINIYDHNINYLYESFNAEVYKNCIYFVGWIDKNTLIKHIHSLPEKNRCWSFSNSKRYFWNFKIKDSHKPSLIIPYLKSL